MLTFTYSEAMAPASILAGWNGASIDVNVRVTDSGALDTLSIWDAANRTKLALTGDLRLRADHDHGGGARLAGTVVLNGNAGRRSRVGAVASGSDAGRPPATSTMLWTPVTAATDLAGNAVSGTALTETGSSGHGFLMRVSHAVQRCSSPPWGCWRC